MRPIFTTSDSFESLRDCLHTYKTFVVRGAVDPLEVKALAARAESAYTEHDRRTTHDDLFGQGHIPVTEIGSSALENIANSGYVKMLQRRVFLSDIRLECPRDFLVRRILPPVLRNKNVAPVIPYHQDEYFGIISDPTYTSLRLCFTMWLPLVSCGRDAPGLTVVERSDTPVVMGKPRFGWNAYIRWKYGRKAFWSPEFEPGDLLVFTNRVIHGSYVTPTMTRPRYSIEMRGGIN